MHKYTQKVKEVDLYVKMPRFLPSAYLNGSLKFDEWVVLTWLWMHANPYNARITVSYSGLSQDLARKYSKNYLNKMMLSLKRQKYISFPKQQGRRGSFEVMIDRYPLASGRYSSIGEGKQKRSRGQAEHSPKQDRSQSEVETSRQKIKETKRAITERLSVNR